MLTKQQAAEVWNILVECCGADADGDMPVQFFHSATTTPNLEFRFQGRLGFGGKVFLEHPPRVSCYQEDSSPKRRTMMNSANLRLQKIIEKT